MQSKKLWQEKLDSYRDQMVQSLSELIAIPSVAVGKKGDAPFGTEVQRAFDYMLHLAEENDMDTVNIDNYGGHIEFGGWVYDEDGDAIDRNTDAIGIISHLDVVPVEEKDWDTPPFELTTKEDGRIYGRGTSDDKGPTMAAFYAMKALKDAGYRPKKRVRMILGLDEETGWVGMKKYLEKVAPPEMSLVPDSNFPVTYAEKGMLVFELAAKFGKGLPKGGTTLRSITGGTVHNAVPASASALVRADSYELIKAKAAAFRERTGYSIRCIGRGKSLEIQATGIAAHAARPERGLNAISVLMTFLGEIPDFNNEDVKDFIRFYNDHIGMETDGASMGCACTDDIVGPLTFNVGIVKADEKAAQLTINVRMPLECDDEQFYSSIMPVADKWNLGVVKVEFKKSHHVPKDSHLVTTLMDVYREATGDLDIQPQTMGGATYARSMPNAVAFGAGFPDAPARGAHQANESASVDELMRAAHIYGEAIYRLAECEEPAEEPEASPETFVLKSLEDTDRLGAAIAAAVQPGTVIALNGDLGAGKTHLTKAIAKGLGVTEMITSPTFTLVQEYESGRMPLYHFDIYRLCSEEELWDIGCEEYFYGKGLSVVEWASQAPGVLPETTVQITMEYGEDEDTRICTISGLPLTF